MIKKLMLLPLVAILGFSAYAVDANKPGDGTTAEQPSKPDTPIVRRYSIFSTSTDWEAVTGLHLAEYRGTFTGVDKKLIGNKGLVLYYLDGFPCYGLGSWVRAWISPAGKADEHLRIACVYAPSEIKFAWRNATAQAIENTTTGMLTCPVETRGREMTINLSKCIKDEDWDKRR